jgi:hypothetical protein
VGGSAYEKGLGSDLFFRYVFIVFLNSPHRETPKNVIKQIREKIGFGFLAEEVFTKNSAAGKTDIESVVEILNWTFCKNILMVFLNFPCRETPKNVLKKNQEKKGGWWVGGSEI